MLITSLRAFIVYVVLLGVVYPCAITVISHFTMPERANGSLIIINKKVVGSALIGQDFTDAKYFHGRFSATNYDSANSKGDNFGPSNKKFLSQIADRIKKIRTENNLTPNTQIPADMVLTSASGLDPHISLRNAMLQLPRIAKMRNLSSEKIHKLIEQNTNHDFIGIWGQDGVNVLKLNLALDALTNGARKNYARKH